MPDAGGTGDGYSVGEFENKVEIGAGETSIFESPNGFTPSDMDKTAYALIPVSFQAAPDAPTTRSPQFTVDFDWTGDWSDVFAASSDLQFEAINPVFGWGELDDSIVGVGYDDGPAGFADLAFLPGGGGYAANQGSPTGLGMGGQFHMTRSLEGWWQAFPLVAGPNYFNAQADPLQPVNILLFLMFGRVLESGVAPSASFTVYQTWDGEPLPEFEPCPPRIEWPYLPEGLGIDGPDTGVIRVGLR